MASAERKSFGLETPFTFGCRSFVMAVLCFNLSDGTCIMIGCCSIGRHSCEAIIACLL